MLVPDFLPVIRDNLHSRDISPWETDLEAILHYMKQNVDPSDPEIDCKEIYDYDSKAWYSWVYKWTIGPVLVK